MADFHSLPPHRLLFDLAARLGSLEGYLYAREKVETSYLPNWLHHIEKAYALLPEEIRSEIRPDYLALLHKAHHLLRDTYGSEDLNSKKLALMIASTARGDRGRD
jgi:hypothetical protein